MSFWRLSLGRAAVMVVQAAATRGLGVASSALLARLLTPADFGSLQAVSNLATTMTQTLKLSLDAGLQIRMSESESESEATGPSQSELIGASLLWIAALASISVVLGLCFGEWTARLFGDLRLVNFTALAGIFAAGQLVAQIGSLLLAFGAFRIYAGINAWGSLLYLVLLAVAYVVGVRGLPVAVGAFGSMQVGVGVLMLVFSVRAWRARGVTVRFTRLGPASYQLMQIGLPLYLAAAVPSLASLVVTANLARVTGIAALASLRVVASLNQLVAFVPSAFAQTFITQFAGIRGGASHVPALDFLRYLRLIVAGGVLSAIGTAVIAPQLVPLVFGANYYETARLVALGVMTTLVVATKQAALVGLISERRTSFSLIDSLVVSALYALLSHLLTGGLGITGLMLAELGSQLVSLMVVGFVIAPRFVQAGVASEAYKTAFSLMLGLAALLGLYFSFDSELRWLTGLGVLVGAAVMVWLLLTTEQERSALLPLLRSLQQRKHRG